MIIIYVTHENEAEANRIVKQLLDKRLIACSVQMPAKSCYWWQGAQASTDEVVTLLKTRDDLWAAVRQEIESIHPYDIPCILKLNVEANEAYEEWVRKETR